MCMIYILNITVKILILIKYSTTNGVKALIIPLALID